MGDFKKGRVTKRGVSRRKISLAGKWRMPWRERLEAERSPERLLEYSGVDGHHGGDRGDDDLSSMTIPGPVSALPLRLPIRCEIRSSFQKWTQGRSSFIKAVLL